MLYKTNKVYKDIETNEKFCLWTDSDTHEFKLISDGSKIHAKGTTVNGWYLCTFDNVTIKINNTRVIKLKQGTFYNMKEGETITHKKFAGQKKMIKQTI